MATLLFGSVAEAQMMMRWEGRGFVNASIGGQVSGEDVAADAGGEVYSQRLSITSEQDVGAGALWDFSAGYRVWRNLVVGLGYSQFGNDTNTTATVRIPHPRLTNQPRVSTVDAAGLDHSQRALHFVASWMVPDTDKIDVAVSVGPSIFFVKQDIVTDVAFSEIGEPFTSVNIGGPIISDVDETGAGFNVGADVTYLLRPKWGVGAFLRYAGAGVSFDEVLGGEIDAGGFQLGLGARYRF
jgi:hypothetical protein